MKFIKLNNQRLGSLLSIVLQNQSPGLKSSNPDRHIVKILDTYIASIDHSIKCTGLLNTIKVFKELHLIATKVAMGISFEPLPFRKTNKAGVPKLLTPVYQLLIGQPNEKRLALTITKLYVGLVSKPSEDFSSITEPSAFDGKSLGAG